MTRGFQRGNGNQKSAWLKPRFDIRKSFGKIRGHLNRLRVHNGVKFFLLATLIKSVRGLAELTGEDWSYIAKILKTLELPPPIQNFLSSQLEPIIAKTFHLCRLLAFVRLGDEDLQFTRFREMLSEIEQHFQIPVRSFSVKCKESMLK